MSCVAVGLRCSTVAPTRSRAISASLVTWIIAIGLGTLAIPGATLRWGLPDFALTAWAFGNPIEAFRLGVISWSSLYQHSPGEPVETQTLLGSIGP